MKIYKNSYLVIMIFLLIAMAGIFFSITKTVGHSVNINDVVEKISESGDNCTFLQTEHIVSGVSMVPVLNPSDEILAFEGYYNCNSVERGDIVLVGFDWRDKPLVKFARGLPGDAFGLKQVEDKFNILINGEVLVNSEGDAYVIDSKKADLISLYIGDYDGVIPVNTYLIMGNDPRGTYDSTKFGLIGQSSLIAKVHSEKN
ncbi:MAG: signal peptidase I [Nanoarchaeota archaeon]|nr:signal peptidase I [Nanoarchaeota archaeon]